VGGAGELSGKGTYLGKLSCELVSAGTSDGSNTTFTWTGAAAEKVGFGLRVERAANDYWYASCAYSGASGSGRIPNELFAQMPKGVSGIVTIGNSASVKAESGTHRTTLRASGLPKGWSIAFMTK